MTLQLWEWALDNSKTASTAAMAGIHPLPLLCSEMHDKGQFGVVTFGVEFSDSGSPGGGHSGDVDGESC